MSCLTRLVVIVLTLLSLAGYSPAVAQAVGGARQMVICGAAGAQTVWLDAAGNPVNAPAKCCNCLDCALCGVALLPEPATDPLVLAIKAGTWHPPLFQTRPVLEGLAPLPRGPPSGQASARPSCKATPVWGFPQGRLT